MVRVSMPDQIRMPPETAVRLSKVTKTAGPNGFCDGFSATTGGVGVVTTTFPPFCVVVVVTGIGGAVNDCSTACPAFASMSSSLLRSPGQLTPTVCEPGWRKNEKRLASSSETAWLSAATPHSGSHAMVSLKSFGVASASVC